MRLRNEYLVLQSPESTPASTSGSSTGGAPEGAPDVGSKVTNEPVVEETTDWNALDLDADEAAPNEIPGDGEPAPSPDAATPEPGKQPTPQPQPGEQPKPGDQPAPSEPQPQPDQPQPQPQPQETEAQRQERERVAAEAEKKDFEALKEYYKLPDDAVDRLRTEPELVLPELAARMHQAVYKGMQQWSMQQIPAIVAYQTKAAEANRETKDMFYGRWPSLKGKDEKVLQVASMYRQMNPKATPQERLENVGKMVCAALGITPDPAPNSGQPPPQRTGQPPAGRRPPTQPMRPANPAGSTGSAPPPPDNVYTELAEEFDAEDRGT